MTNRFKTLTHVAIYIVLAVTILGGTYWLIADERYAVDDWLALRNYQPSQPIIDLANADMMTAYTRHMFYINHPEVAGKSQFAKQCPNVEVNTEVLGCFHQGQKGIFILSVNQPELAGIEQETAAYETLHAVYERLPSGQKQQLNKELTNYYNVYLGDSVIKNQIAIYQRSEPGFVDDEMFSVFGTEVSYLPPDLTAIYSKYFVNRAVVVGFYQAYQSAFSSRQQQISTYDSQLASLNTQITADESALAAQLSSIQSGQTTLNSDKSSGSITAYNALVPGYNQQVDSYNNLVSTVQSLVSQYNQIVSSRNSIALEEQQLVQAISATSQPISN